MTITKSLYKLELNVLDHCILDVFCSISCSTHLCRVYQVTYDRRCTLCKTWQQILQFWVIKWPSSKREFPVWLTVRHAVGSTHGGVYTRGGYVITYLVTGGTRTRAENGQGLIVKLCVTQGHVEMTLAVCHKYIHAYYIHRNLLYTREI
jgi:hypothetical protein